MVSSIQEEMCFLYAAEGSKKYCGFFSFFLILFVVVPDTFSFVARRYSLVMIAIDQENSILSYVASARRA